MSYVYPVESHSLNILMPKYLRFFLDVLLENYPSLEFHSDFIYCQIFGRVVKFLKVRPYNFKQVSYVPVCHLFCPVLLLSMKCRKRSM